MGPSPYCRQFSTTTASPLPSTTQIKEAILLLNTGKPGPQTKTDLVPIHSPLDSLKLHRAHVHRRLLPLRPRPIRYCSRLSPKSPHNWCSCMDRWLCHAGLSRNEWADSLAKIRATLPVTHVPCSLAPTIAKIRHTRYSLWTVNCLDFAATVTAFFCPLTYAG